jgi:hypothetical protein
MEALVDHASRSLWLREGPLGLVYQALSWVLYVLESSLFSIFPLYRGVFVKCSTCIFALWALGILSYSHFPHNMNSVIQHREAAASMP